MIDRCSEARTYTRPRTHHLGAHRHAHEQAPACIHTCKVHRHVPVRIEIMHVPVRKSSAHTSQTACFPQAVAGNKISLTGLRIRVTMIHRRVPCEIFIFRTVQGSSATFAGSIRCRGADRCGPRPAARASLFSSTPKRHHRGRDLTPSPKTPATARVSPCCHSRHSRLACLSRGQCAGPCPGPGIGP